MSYINCVHVMCEQIWPLRTGEVSVSAVCGQIWPIRTGGLYIHM